MTRKRQSNSSVISIADEENLENLQDIDEEAVLKSAHESNDNFINMEINTDNIEDIVTEKMDVKIKINKNPKSNKL